MSYYEQNASLCAERWDAIDGNSGIARFFTTAFPQGGRVLDVGCGSGRDLAILRRAGFEAFGVEPAAALRAYVVGHRPDLESILAEGSLPELNLPRSWPSSFDGIVCSAVLMHLPDDELPGAVHRLHELLAPGGRLLLSVPSERPGIIDGRDAAGRLFSGIRATELGVLAGGVGFEVVNLGEGWGDRQGREGYSWDALLLVRSGSSVGS